MASNKKLECTVHTKQKINLHCLKVLDCYCWLVLVIDDNVCDEYFVFQAPNQEAALSHLSNIFLNFNLVLIFFQLLVKSRLFGITLADLSKQSSQGRCRRIDRFDDDDDDDDDNE